MHAPTVRRTPCAIAATLAPRLALAGGLAYGTTAGAQVVDSVRADSLPVSCAGRTITAIDVQPYPPAVIGRSPSAFKRFVQKALFQSATTRESAVRPFLLARVGQDCTDQLLSETARVLRSRPYIAAATVVGEPDGPTGVRVRVETVDEIPLVIGGGWGSGGPSAVTFGNANVLGYGVEAVGRWREGNAYRDGIAFSARHHGTFGKPIVLSLDASRDPIGGRVAYAITRPFLSDLQHLAWHAGGAQGTTYHRLARPDQSTLLLPMRRDAWTAGTVARLSGRRYGVLLGPVATYERTRPEDALVIASDSGLVPGERDDLADRYPSRSSFRLGGAAGVRLLSFAVVRGFDALLAEQDVARGVQLGAMLTRGLASGDPSDFASMDLYAGAGGQSSFVGLRLRGEGEHRRDTDEWRAMVLGGRAAWYLKPSLGRTYETSVEFTGGWRERLPLQLSLGEARAGVRGYKGATILGGRRALVRLEERRAIRSMGRLVHLGTAVFTDVGKTWAGDVPFGETTIARMSVGGGLLLAVPARSRRTIRADVSVPVTGGAPKRWLIRVAATDFTRTFWREPGDLSTIRAASPPSSIFGWP